MKNRNNFRLFPADSSGFKGSWPDGRGLLLKHYVLPSIPSGTEKRGKHFWKFQALLVEAVIYVQLKLF